jgi:heptosyltransferase-2
MIDRCTALARPKNSSPADLPLPELRIPPGEVSAWRQKLGLAADSRRTVAVAPGAVGPSKRWSYFAELARRLVAEGNSVWVIGGPDEKPIAAEIAAAGGEHVRDLTGSDLRNAALALAAADAAVSNDSGLLHVAAAIGTPAVGIFGPTSPWHWAPLNPLAAVVQAASDLPCRPCHKPTCRLVHHRCMRDIAVEQVLSATRDARAVMTLQKPT